MTTDHDAVLAVEDLTAGYGELEILHAVDLEVRADEIVTIIGPNGAGKSTLLKAVFGLIEPTGGRILLDGDDLVGLQPQEIVKRGISYVPQVDNVFPNLTVRENLELGAWLIRDRAVHDRATARVHDLFPALADRTKEKVGNLSGGQRQMVAMGRALMSEPELLILDEPSAGLAPNLVDDVFGNIQTVAGAGVPVLLVEQNARKALSISDRGYVLDQGRNKYEGPGPDLLADEKLGRLYLGG